MMRVLFFCGTENDGLFILNKEGEINSLKYERSKTKGIKSNSIWSTFIDDKNRIWLGYFNQGIDIYDKEKNGLNLLKVFQTKTNRYTQSL